jgi:D-alanyl-D-alanine-carboxypeptidase/D-alanyl-D-alanine-endopeptidase
LTNGSFRCKVRTLRQATGRRASSVLFLCACGGWLLLAALLAACGGSHRAAPVAKTATPRRDPDPDGPHRADIVKQIQPYVDGELVDGIVVAIYDGGKREIYGFGKLGSAAPNGKTLYELGAVTRVFTGLLVADGIQRKEIQLNTPLADTMPPGVTVPMKDNQTITLGALVLDAAGLPPQPPHVNLDAADPYAPYTEDILYADLVGAQLDRPPGKTIVASTWGYGLLGVALGRKLGDGGGYAKVMRARVLDPLELRDTFLDVPAAAHARLAAVTDTDLKPVSAWHWNALAGAGAMVSDARDLLALIDAELDANVGGKRALRPSMRTSQEPAIDRKGANLAIGWQIDENGRYWQTGTTGGNHAFVGFDPKTRRGVVVLASTALSVPLDHIPGVLYRVMSGEADPPPAWPTPEQLAPVVGTYDLAGAKLAVAVQGKRFYMQGPGEPPMRLVPLTDSALWIEQLQSIVAFPHDGSTIKAMVFANGNKELSAARVQ